MGESTAVATCAGFVVVHTAVVIDGFSRCIVQACIDACGDSVGDSCDNTLAQTIIRQLNADVIHARGAWHTLEALEYFTLQRVDCDK